MSHFREDLGKHKREVGRVLSFAQQELAVRAVNHDMDKIEKDIIFETYEEHSEAWRDAPFGGKEKRKLRKVMAEGIDEHVINNRHHFYGQENPMGTKDINLFDMMENLSDWIAASDRDCHTKEEKMNRVANLINQYYGRDLDSGAVILKIIALNTAEKLIEMAY